MGESKRRVWLGALIALFLLAGAWAPAPISADTAALSTPTPDLIIETVTWSPENPSIRDKVTFTVTIKNQGGSQASPSHIAYYIDDTYQDSAKVNQIVPGATVTQTFTWTAQGGSHAIKAVADSNNSVTESNEANNEKIFVFSVIAPDLVIQDINWSPENPSIRDKVLFTVTVKNQGNKRARCSHVDLRIDSSSRGYLDVPRIEAGASVNKTFTWTAQAGSHAITAVADLLNQVSEGDESNNEKTVAYSTTAPDLVISTITWSPANPSENATVTLTVTIKNQGSGKADRSWVTCYIDDVSQSSVHINQLDTGTTVAKTFTWTAKTGSHTFKAVADSEDRVIESDETNNEKMIDLPAPAVTAPDLVIQNITWSPTSPLVAHRVVFTVFIKNQGTSRAGYSRLYFCIDDYYKWQQDVPELDAGATANKTITWATRESSHVVKAIADVENYVIESDETNNEKTGTVTCSGSPTSDLIIQDITWSPVSPSIGDAVTFTVDIKNQGSSQAGPSHIAYYIDDTYQDLIYVNQISAGATAANTFTWTAQAGSHTLRAVLDSNNIITESDETNNEKTTAFSVSAPDLVINTITWSPENPSEGTEVTFVVTIKNQGSERASRSCAAYYIDGSYRGYHNVPEIDAGANVTETFTWTVQAGSHTIEAVADVESDIPESNESNNEKMATFPAPDLIIETITWSPVDTSENATVTFSITVKNQSGGRAGSSDVYFYIDGSSQGYENIQELEAGASVSKAFTWAAQGGSHTIRAVADGENQVSEGDESNNEKSVTFSVFVPPSAPPAPSSAPQPAPILTTELKQEDADVHPYVQDSHVHSGQDEAPAEDPPPDHSSEQGTWLSWWLILAVVVLGGTAIVVMLRLRRRRIELD